MRWFVIVAMVPLAAYGLLNIFSPATTIGWQNRSTAHRSRDGRNDLVGSAFQRIIGQMTPDGRHDPRLRKRVRLLGIAEVLIAVWVIAGAA